MMNEILCGIDLGTTNSSIACLREGRPVALPVEEGSALVPSVVSLDEQTGAIIVGRRAKNRLAAFPQATCRSIKRLMGKETRVTLGGRSFSPEEISSQILKYLVQRGSELLGQEIRKTVITVPAYFNDAQRRATIRAGELAGLEVTRIINEPTAASLVYDHVSLEEQGGQPYIMVYDLGGGTFDISILELRGEIKEVLASCGDTLLGGDDFDERVVRFFMRRLQEQTGFDFSGKGWTLEMRLKEIAEKSKIDLSDAPYVRVKEIGVAMVNGDPVNLDLELTRKDYEEMILDLVEKTTEKVHEALKEANLTPDDIGKIILVGGATRTPLVQQHLSEIFDQPIHHSLDPDLCVALGAAVQSGLIAGEPLGHILLDVTAHSLGVKTLDPSIPEPQEADHFAVIIRRNTKVPARKADVYYTLMDRQEGVDVQVFQGESPSCRQNALVGSFYFPLKPAPAHSPVTVEFAYDKEGVVHVTVDQKGAGNRKEVTLNVRERKVLERIAEAGEQEVLNYIVEKARRLAAGEALPDALREELARLTGDYEKALRQGHEGRDLDTLEDTLLNKIEEAEKRLGD
ncbi:MAG: Hsp70 family protein [Deltaproteobacteria bacterium]|nr:Hsp70 family protein [Deltaproteobacteria bacterium]